MELIFKTAKTDATFRWIYGSTFLLLFLVIFIPPIIEQDVNLLLTLSLICMPVAVFLVLLKRITIILNEKFLTVKVSGIKGYSAEIINITKIKKGATLWAGMHKYGTRTGGLIISAKYKDDLYIAPENEDKFLAKILEINPEIKFEDKTKTDKIFTQ